MKKIVLSVLAGLGLAVFIPAMALAKAATTDVTGVVTYKGANVSKATVTVTCKGDVHTVKTGGAGAYLASYQAKYCPVGSTITVTADWNGYTGTTTGKAGVVTTKLDVAVLNVSVVPELGLITGITAAVVGGGAFLVIRHRKLSGNKV